MSDYRDLVIEDLAASEAAILEQLAVAEADMGTFRELAVAGFDALRDLMVRHERLQAKYDQIADDYRRLREDWLGKIPE